MALVMDGCDGWSAGGGPAGALVLHGFTSNPSSVRPLAEHLATSGFSVELPRLPGHGTHWRDLQRTRCRDWARAAAGALETLAARTRTRVVVGLSFGGCLALHLAQTRPTRLDGLVLINPWVHERDRRLLTLPLSKWVVAGSPEPVNDIARPGMDERAYPLVPLKALASAIRFQRRVRGRLHQVTHPTLVLTSKVDNTIDNANSRVVMDGIAASDRCQVWLDRSRHVATLDYDADLIARRVAAFVTRVSEPRR